MKGQKFRDHSSHHQTACSRDPQGLQPQPPYRTALSQQYSIARFAVLRVLSCLYSAGLQCSSCNVVWFSSAFKHVIL
jgi:hypothetical protein